MLCVFFMRFYQLCRALSIVLCVWAALSYFCNVLSSFSSSFIVKLWENVHTSAILRYTVAIKGKLGNYLYQAHLHILKISQII